MCVGGRGRWTKICAHAVARDFDQCGENHERKACVREPLRNTRTRPLQGSMQLGRCSKAMPQMHLQEGKWGGRSEGGAGGLKLC